MKTISLLILISINFSIISNSQIVSDGCCSKELSDRKLEKLPWYGNNNFLNEILENKNYKKDSQQVFFRIPVTLWVFTPKSDDISIQKLMNELNFYNKNNNTGFEFYYAQIIPKYKSTPFKIGYTIPAFFKGLFYRKKETVNILLVDQLIKKSLFYPTRYYRGQYNHLNKNIVLRLNASSTSMSHEIGHFFGLHHPHRGWKRNKKHQESVSRSRKAIRIFKNAKNCEINGDAICDTPAEPVLIKYVDKDCNYTGDLTDNWGDKYKPNVNNIMSYPTWMTCREDFTEGQKAVMLYTAEKKNISEWSANDQRFQFDQFEPNNSFATATVISNTPLKNTLHLKYAGKHQGVIDTDTDCFVIEKDSLSKDSTLFNLKIKIKSSEKINLLIEITENSSSSEPNIFNIREESALIPIDFSKNKKMFIKISKFKSDQTKLDYTISW